MFSSFPVFATTITPTTNTSAKSIGIQSDKSKIANWNYTIYDANGNVKSTGTYTQSGMKADYSWGGIVLDNGDAVVLRPSNNVEGFYCVEDTEIDFGYSLSYNAEMETQIMGFSDNSGRYSKTVTTNVWDDCYTVPHTDHYYVYLRNLSSDPVSVDNFYLNF